MIDLRTPLDRHHARHAREHALKRLRQRFGIELDMPALKAIEDDLVLGRFRWIAMVRRRRSIVFEVPIGAVKTYAFFNVNLWAIVSFVTDVKARPACTGREDR